MSKEINFFKNMNRHQRKEFDKLSKADQISIIAYEIRKGVENEFSQQITKSFYHGHLNAGKYLYDKYVKEYLELSVDSKNTEQCATIIGNCFAEITRLSEKFAEDFPIDKELEENNKKNKGEQ